MLREGLAGINRLEKIKRRRWKVERTCVYVNVTLTGQVICETNCYQPCLSLYGFGHRLHQFTNAFVRSSKFYANVREHFKSFEEQFEILKT